MRLERSFSPATLTRGIFRIRLGNEPRRVTIDSNRDCKRQSRVASAMRRTPTSYGVRLRRQTLTRLEVSTVISSGTSSTMAMDESTETAQFKEQTAVVTPPIRGSEHDHDKSQQN